MAGGRAHTAYLSPLRSAHGVASQLTKSHPLAIPQVTHPLHDSNRNLLPALVAHDRPLYDLWPFKVPKPVDTRQSEDLLCDFTLSCQMNTPARLLSSPVRRSLKYS